LSFVVCAATAPAVASAQSVAPVAPAAPAAPTAAAASPSPATPAMPAARPIDARSAVRAALLHNPSFTGARLGVAQAKQDVLAEEGRYPFVFGADAGHTRSGSPSGDSSSTILGAQIARTFPFGTTTSLRVQGERFEADRAFPGAGPTASLDDGYGASARFTVTQPLLRGAGRKVGELGLRTREQSKELAQRGVERAESELVRQVLLAYWNLWYADESLRIERAALELARAQEREAIDREAHGAVAQADVYVFSTRVANLEETMVTTLENRNASSRELNRLMGLSADQAPDVSAADAPVPGPLPSAQEVEAALRSGSLELAELEAQVKLARTRAEVAGDSSRPRLDLEGYAETYGESRRLPSAVRRAGELAWWTVHVGASLDLPLDGTRRNAEKESALLGVRMAQQDLKVARDRLAVDAANAVAQARAAEQRVALATRTVDVAGKAHEAARGRFELGGGIAIEVQQAEEELRRARLSLARTRVELVQAQINVRHLAGTLARDFKSG
jgi:outer membrane protein TolC